MVSTSRLARALLLVGALAAPALAQTGAGVALPLTSPFRGGVPAAAATPGVLTLTPGDAIRHALERNLGVLLADQDRAAADGGRWDALSRLLPTVRGTAGLTRRKTNLEAFGFPLGPSFPRVVGPYNVFDARVFLEQALVDVSAVREKSAATHRLEAARHSVRGARELVVLVSANLYLEALAADARAQAARAQLDSSRAIHAQAQRLREGGIVAGLDVVRAEVRLSADEQRATVAENEVQKSKLQLARVIGLPIGQEFVLIKELPEVPEQTMTLDDAVARAYASRPDFLAALEDLRAAESARGAAGAEALPSLRLAADYGTIGLTVGSALPTFSLTGLVEVPIFEGGKHQARVAQADAALRKQQARVEDLRAEVYYDVRTAFLDLDATEQALRTAGRARALADQQLTQSRDRFAAGVAGNIEVIQAQEAVAVAAEQYISALYGRNIARAMLAQSVGGAEEAVMRLIGSQTP